MATNDTTTRIDQPSQQQPQWDIPKEITTYSPLLTPVFIVLLVAWRRWGQKYFDSRKTELLRPYRITDQIESNVQNLRAMCNAHRALLIEVDTKKNDLKIINQAVMDAGIAELAIEFSGEKVTCIKSIAKRFNDNNFVLREVEKIEEGVYRGYMLQRGICWIIYCKLGEGDNSIWFLALHYRYEFYANYETASNNLKQEIIDLCSQTYSLLLQKV
jgi:hypothetical protein